MGDNDRRITAPFNFVPLPEKVFFPDWADQVSHDVPFSDGEDGVITLTIKNVSPLFTRNGKAKDVEERYSSHILLPNKEKRYFIPGTTLKGCFRSVMEILSFAKMQQFNDDAFGMPREFDTKKVYMKSVKDASCGWLYKEENKYFLKECKDGIKTITHRDIKGRFRGFYIGKDHTTAEVKQNSVKNETGYFPLFDKENRLVCTGYMYRKSHEYLFSEAQNDAEIVPNVIVEYFESVHKNTAYYGGKNGKGGFLKKKLDSGERIPVFFTRSRINHTVSAMGITRMFRYPYETTVKNAVKHSSEEHLDKKRQDLPELIFGHINENDSLKGRVLIGHAFSEDKVMDSQLKEVNGVLGQPSASYYPLYVLQEGSVYKSWKAVDAKIAGRKRYRIPEEKDGWPLPKGNGNEKILNKNLFLPQGMTFTCKIIVHNLRKAEIGALLSAITMHKAAGCYHSIGLAKSFGYGVVSMDCELANFKHEVNEYLRAFEIVLRQQGFKLASSPEVMKMLCIANACHTKDEMRLMELKEYRGAKKQFQTLVDNANVKIKSFMTPGDILEASNYLTRAKEAAEATVRKRAEEENLVKTK